MPPRPNPVCLYSSVRRALGLESVSTDSQYMLCMEFAGENGACRRSIYYWLPSARTCWQGWNMGSLAHSEPSYECSMYV